MIPRSSSRPLRGRIETLSNASRLVQGRLDTAPGGAYSTTGSRSPINPRCLTPRLVGASQRFASGRQGADVKVGGMTTLEVQTLPVPTAPARTDAPDTSGYRAIHEAMRVANQQLLDGLANADVHDPERATVFALETVRIVQRAQHFGDDQQRELDGQRDVIARASPKASRRAFLPFA